ncbi:MAG: hypothetical protein Q4C78_02185 [Synergistaceae bacterium]|nr:hypothetical protein [Synergistaceae bacterium]
MEMELKKNLKQQNLEELIKSLELVSARLIESVTKASQLASSETPEMRLLFEEWLNLVGKEIIEASKVEHVIEPIELSRKIGVLPSTILSLALSLHRQGKIEILSLVAREGNGQNTEICNCLR